MTLPISSSEDIIVRVEDLTKWYPIRKSFRSILAKKELCVKAVDGISFDIRRGEILGLVGESGSGKTTTGRLLMRLIDPTRGRVYFNGDDIFSISHKEMSKLRRKLQIIFQDPFESLDPQMAILDAVSEPLQVNRIGKDPREILQKVKTALEEVGLTPPEEFYRRYPHQLSGGQRQRVAIARALVLNPELIVADEPVSMLDVSIRASVINIMLELREKLNLSYLFIAHDLALVRHVCDRAAIMYLGKIVELGTADNLVYDPLHPYTRALIAAVPKPDPKDVVEILAKGDIPSPINPPKGCRFHPRCTFAQEICKKEEPPYIEIKKGHFAACHFAGEI